MPNSHNNNTKKNEGWNVKEPVRTEDFSAPMRVFYDTAKLERAIQQFGVRVKIYRSSFCPNIKSIDGGEHNLNCPLCDGSGFVDVLPLETIAWVHDVSLEKVFAPEGLIDRCSTRATFLQGIELQYFTKIELLDFSTIYMQRVKRSETNTDNLQYGALRVNFILDQYGVYYYQAIDFEIDTNGNIKWTEGRGPKKATIYTIHYECLATYRAVKAIHVNRFAQIKGADGRIEFTKLFEEWELERSYLSVRRDAAGNEIVQNKIY